MNVVEGLRNRVANLTRSVPTVPCNRPLPPAQAVRHRLKIVEYAKDIPPAGAVVPEPGGLVLREVRVMELEVAERQRRCQIVSTILLRLAAYDGTCTQDVAA